MATKVYLLDGFVFAEQTGEPILKIVQRVASFAFVSFDTSDTDPLDQPIPKSCKIKHGSTGEYRVEIIADIQDQSGTPIGDVLEVLEYLKGFIFANISITAFANGNVADAKLDAISNSNQTIATAAAGTIVTFPVSLISKAISISDGVITFNVSSTYTFYYFFNLNITSGNNNKIETWLECSLNGASWSALQNSGRTTEYTTVTEDHRSYFATLDVNIDSANQYRIHIRASDGSSNQLKAATLNNGVAAPSAELNIIKG